MKRVSMILLVIIAVCCGNVFALTTAQFRDVDGSWNETTKWVTYAPSTGTVADPLLNVDIRVFDNSKTGTVTLNIDSGSLYTQCRIMTIGYNASGAVYMNGGTLEMGVEGGNGDLIIGRNTVAGSTNNSSFTLVDGTVTVADDTWIGYSDGVNATLEILGGTYSTYELRAPLTTGSANSLVKLYGGVLELTRDEAGALLLNYGGATGGGIDIKNDAQLIWAGDHTVSFLGDQVSNGFFADGLVYTSEAGKSLQAVYDEINNQTVVTVVPEPTTIALLSIGGLLLRKKR